MPKIPPSALLMKCQGMSIERSTSVGTSSRVGCVLDLYVDSDVAPLTSDRHADLGVERRGCRMVPRSPFRNRRGSRLLRAMLERRQGRTRRTIGPASTVCPVRNRCGCRSVCRRPTRMLLLISDRLSAMDRARRTLFAFSSSGPVPIQGSSGLCPGRGSIGSSLMWFWSVQKFPPK